jgi:hypothetical protein
MLDRDRATERARALDAMQAAYSAAGIERYAAWVHESDESTRAELSARGFTIAESTRAMGMSLDEIAVPQPEAGIGWPDWSEYLEYLRIVGVPAGLLSGVYPTAFHVLAARVAGENVATDRLRSRRRPRRLQRVDPRGCAPARVWDRAHGAPGARRCGTWVLDGERAVD